MKNKAILLLKPIVVIFGVMVLLILIRLPLIEGRAENLDLFSIYTDPFILYGYLIATVFYFALFKLYKILEIYRQKDLHSIELIKELKTLKKSALLISLLIFLGAVYIKLFHDKDDDPAGFLALSIIAIFISISVAKIISVINKRIIKKNPTKM